MGGTNTLAYKAMSLFWWPSLPRRRNNTLTLLGVLFVRICIQFNFRPLLQSSRSVIRGYTTNLFYVLHSKYKNYDRGTREMYQLRSKWYRKNPRTGLDKPRVFQETEAPRFHDNRHMKVVSLLALRTGRLHPPGKISGTHFCQRLSRLQGHFAAGRITLIKKFHRESNPRPSDSLRNASTNCATAYPTLQMEGRKYGN